MKFRKLLPALLGAATFTAPPAGAVTCPAVFDTPLPQLHSAKTINPCELMAAARAVVVVNTASNCGFTPQFEGLQKLYDRYQQNGLVILGFPSNSFFQEEKEQEDIANVCFKNYGVSFAMFEPVAVKGDDAHPIFAWLSTQTKKPSWNFNKYLITDAGVSHFGSRTAPLDSDLEQAISASLSAEPQ